MKIIINLWRNILIFIILFLSFFLIYSQIPCGKSFVSCENSIFERKNAIDYNIIEGHIYKIDGSVTTTLTSNTNKILIDEDMILTASHQAEMALLNNMKEKKFIDKPNDKLIKDSIMRYIEVTSQEYQKNNLINGSNLNTALSKELKTMGLNLVDLKIIKIPENISNIMSEICIKNKKNFCTPSSYRTINGECNNVNNPTLGSVYEPFQRILSPDYEDYIMLPRSSYKKEQLPNERELTTKLFNYKNDRNVTISNLFAYWFHLISSDISLISSITKTSSGEDIIPQCCSPNTKKMDNECDPLEISSSDSIYRGLVTCIPYTRSIPTIPKNCNLGQREQANFVTSYIDGSSIYGISINNEKELREYVNGKLKTVIFNNDSELLSADITTSEWCQLSSNYSCFKTGTKDGNIFPGSSTLRTILVKYHNYIAINLKKLNPFWDDEKIYQESKKIIIGKIQFITYNEFLPILLGEKNMIKYKLKLRNYGYESNYDITINSNVFNEVSILLNPLLFSMINEMIRLVDNKGWIIKNFNIGDTFNDPSLLYEKDGIENIIRFLTLEKINPPSLLIPEIFKSYYLSKRGNFGLDSISLAIKKGRDHGIKGYRFYRQACGLSDITNFNDLEKIFYSKDVVNILSSLYDNINDVELIIGSLGEKPIDGSLLGPTLSCILGKQFEILKYGDRYWFENYFTDSSFTIKQLDEIRKSSISEIICVGSNINSLQPNTFLLPDKFSNTFLNCNNNAINKMKFKYWKDDEKKIEIPITKETIEKVFDLAELNVKERIKRELKNINVNQTNFQKGDPLYAWSNMLRPKERSKEIGKIAEILLESTKILINNNNLPGGEKLPKLSIEHIQKMLPEIDVSRFIFNYTAFLSDNGRLTKDQCLPQNLPCDHTNKYRIYSGWCNNLKHPEYGNAFQPLKHLLTPVYDDGFDKPRIKSITGKLLPNPRIISNKIHEDKNISHVKFTHMVMQFGQFLDHDLTHSPTSRGPNNEILNCTRCDSPETISVHCSPIPIEIGDPHFPTHYPNGEKRCLPFARSLLGQLNLGYRNQLNQLTSFIDGSAIYGSTDCEANQLRFFSKGLLKYSNIGLHNTEALPQGEQEKDCRSLPKYKCFVSGDERNSHQPGLTMMHTIFMREHNRIVKKLSIINPHWNDEKLYQEGRRIQIGQFQHIVFSEFIPKIIGIKLLDKYDIMVKKDGYYKKYDETCDPQISQPFATAAYRFGHTLIRRLFPRLDKNFKEISDPIDISTHFGHVEPIYNGTAGGIDSIIMGLLGTPSMAFDRHITSAVRNHLFARRGEKTSGMDLIAINILRARDHGVQSYNTFREFCGFKKATNFNDLLNDMDSETVFSLQSVYEDVNDIDLFPGLISEKPLRGALLGPTMACLIAEQFSRLKKCDRYYYENNNEVTKFTLRQLREIRKIKLSTIFCQNSNYIKTIQPNVFDMPDDLMNSLVDCENLGKINLNEWKEDLSCQIKDKEIELGKTIDITPCVSCTCTKDGTICHPKKIINCEKLLSMFSKNEILNDTSCIIQCSILLKK
ncbi:Peroxidasin-like protein [Strongyloides ratti]|uniref:Peroxidasin-like protein n=1 Tax=Strongyloides ratti TaxID=34506 RepID=A0A090LLP9_STRRB|nr:Peroxidasin-like protein [Strongyloides ratti]CEF70720.1 Peroxidasin-like protein [Strongyloides ratti]